MTPIASVQGLSPPENARLLQPQHVPCKPQNPSYVALLIARPALAFLVAAACAGVCPSAAAAPPEKAFDWKIRRIELRDYLPLERVAAFYGLELNTADRRLHLDGECGSIITWIGSREMLVNGVRHWLSFPVIETPGGPLVTRIDLVKTIHPALRPTAIRDLGPVDTVILDAGHGGKDGGAGSLEGMEKEWALDVALKIKASLERSGLAVVLTRESDYFVPLESRAAAANRYPRALFVSIHFNAASNNPHARGFEVFALSPFGAPGTNDPGLRPRHFRQENGHGFDAASFALATSIQHSVLGNLEKIDRGVRRARFAVLKLTRMPAVLVEGAFLSNPEDARRAAQPAWRTSLADAVANGILEFRRLAQEGKPPKLLAEYRQLQPLQMALATPLVPEGEDLPMPREE